MKASISPLLCSVAFENETGVIPGATARYQKRLSDMRGTTYHPWKVKATFAPAVPEQTADCVMIRAYSPIIGADHFAPSAFGNRMRWVDHPDSFQITVWHFSPRKVAIGAHQPTEKFRMVPGMQHEIAAWIPLG